jgi:hypothetical protein
MIRTAIEPAEAHWLLLLHQIPPRPGYLRVKVWRRLQRLGAVAIKKSVYVLPRSEQAIEDFQWLLREIVEDGGDASVCEARFVEGLSDEQVEALFHAARDADYAVIAEEARKARTGKLGERRTELEAEVARLRRRFAEVTTIDFLGAPGREAAEEAIAVLEARLLPAEEARPSDGSKPLGRIRGRTWVTRRGIHIDRMASAWLIRRFIDPKARFKFVPARGYKPEPGELRFDMFQAELTHEGERCTFEVLLEKFDLEDRALHAIAEIVHDIDLKDPKYGRPEAPGVDHLVSGIAMTEKEDEGRLARAATVFGSLYEYFRRRRP